MFGKANISSFQWKDLQERVIRLEEKAFGKKKPPITLNQQILVMHHLGMLDKIRELDIPTIKKAEILSIILKGDFSNTKKAIEAFPKKDDDTLKNYFNYNFLSKFFEVMELEDKTIEVNNILREFEIPEK